MKSEAIEARWSLYRLVDDAGVTRRLLKLTASEADGVGGSRLLSSKGEVLDEEPVPPGMRGPWHFGFWVPEAVAPEQPFALETFGANAATRIDLRPGPLPKGHERPLRMDRTGEWLRNHLETRESLPNAADLAGFVPSMGAYLRQHRIIYEKPAVHWAKGLPLGNGVVGALVTGQAGRSQTFYLDRADLWATTHEGRPIGRVYAGQIDITFDAPGDFLQELDLHGAEVATRQGRLTTAARVNAEHDVFEVEMCWEGEQPLEVNLAFSRRAMPLLEGDFGETGAKANGSWEATTSPADMEKAREVVRNAPHTSPELTITGDTALIEHLLPNMAYAMAARVEGASTTWHDASGPHEARSEASITIRPGQMVRLAVAVASDRAGSDPAARASALLQEDLAGHAAWWARFWERTFVELPDKLVENLWYFGVYHQAAFSRSLQAPGFLALWHPLDYRTWDDGYVADAQTALMWYAPFAANHIELMLPHHHTFGRMLPEFLEHNPADGALVPHHFFPEWAGGHTAFGKPNPYKGSIAWFALNFWWDYCYTGDKTFLEDVAYPLIAACADFHAADLVREDDGRFHCIDSGAPEQNDTARDNVYDRACIGAALRAAVEAAAVLGGDKSRAARWQEVLDNLFEFPADDNTLWECPASPHPYRCHPVVTFGIHPTGTIEPGSPLWDKAQAAYEVVTNLFGLHYEDRHATIPGHEGGVEPNGHATAFLMNAAARLRGWPEVRRLFYALAVRTQLKRNGLRAICDPRQAPYLTNMGISEAVSGQTAGISEVLLQSYSDHVRVFAGTGEGMFRFAGLRAFGGFILAGECIDGQVRSITVHSLCGNTLRFENPWPGQRIVVKRDAKSDEGDALEGAEILELETETGQTLRLCPEGTCDAAPAPVIEERSGPRSVDCGDWDDFDPPVVYYPETPPYAQDSADGRVYLGMPAEEKGREIRPDWQRVRELAQRPDWPARQTAARRLAHLDSDEATEQLIALATADECPVVRYTAGVSLVRQGTVRSIKEALLLARTTDAPHLRREILKAVSRLQRTDAGARQLRACLGDLAVLEALFGGEADSPH